MHRTKVRAWAALALACALAVTLAACGDSKDSASTTSTTASGGDAAAQAKLDRWYAGSYGAPPTTAPKAQPGKNVWLVSCGQTAASCANGVGAAKQAAGVLGWKATVYDGRGDPNQMLSGIRSAIAAKADGIFVYAIDCAYVQPGLQEARKAGIPVVAAESADCSDTKAGAPSLFTYVVHYVDDTAFLPFLRSWGGAQADWDIAQLGGKAKIIDFRETDGTAVLASDAGFRKELATCGGCEIVDTVEFVLGDFGPSLQQKAEQALLKHPEANGVEIPYDAVMTGGVGAALRGSGRIAKMKIMGGEGNVANMDLIRGGQGQDAIVGLPTEWEGWSGIDNLNRIFNGKPTVNSGIGLQIVDKEHNLPASGPFVPMRDGKPIDFAGLYTKAFTGR